MNDQDDVHPWKIAWVILGWCSRSHWRNALKTTLRSWKARDFGAIFPSHFGLEHLGVYIGIPGGFPKIHPQMIQVIFPGWWFGTWIWFSMIYIYMGCHPSHWRTHVFQDGYCTTNQISIEYWSLWWLAEPWRTRSIDRLGDCSASGAMRWCEGVDDKHELYMGS